MRRDGGALVGVGRTITHIMPLSGPAAAADHGHGAEVSPVLDVVAKDVTVGMVTVVTWDHLPGYAVQWRGTGIWRQSFFNRVDESEFPPFSATADLRPAHHPGTPFGRPLAVIDGGGAFYDFNLDFGHVVPAPGIPTGPDKASSDEVLLQQPGYRSLLVNGSTAGVRFYPLNMEQTFGEAYVTFRLNFHHFHRFELDLRGHTQPQGTAFSCLRFKSADKVLI